MLQNIKFFKEPHELAELPESSSVLVALSGGADSSALLHLMCRYKDKLGFKLYAAHVNHNIRTQHYNNEAERDETFCRSVCARLGVELFVASIDVPTMALDTGKSIETAARDARYGFFAKVMQQNSIKILATAHNADDNLETQIFNLSRGCGIEGICGIPQARPFPQVEGGIIVRPILSASKADILNYCADEGIEFVNDSTNLENDCTRNRIRHKIIPELTSIFGSPQRNARRLSIAAEQDSDFILGEAKKFLQSSGTSINLQKFNSLHIAVAKRVVLLSFAEISERSLEYVHVEDILRLAKDGSENSYISLPDKKRAAIKNGTLIFENDLKQTIKKPILFSQKLKSGFNIIEGSDFAVAICNNAHSAELIEMCDALYVIYASALIKNSSLDCLYARNRQTGDIIRDGGVGKKIKKLMCDKKLRLDHRDILPLICSAGDVIYVPKCAVADKAKADKNNFEINITIYIKKQLTEDTP